MKQCNSVLHRGGRQIKHEHADPRKHPSSELAKMLSGSLARSRCRMDSTLAGGTQTSARACQSEARLLPAGLAIVCVSTVTGAAWILKGVGIRMSDDVT